MICEAVISPCGVYRYRLTRVWDTGLTRLLWVMLNPSTADATSDDPTIRRVTAFTKRFGYGGFDVVNLYSYRATNPRDLATASDRFGPDHKHHRAMALTDCSGIVVAWGSSAFVKQAPRLFWCRLPNVKCLGTTKTGHPRHPLYVKGDRELMDWWRKPHDPATAEGEPE